MQTTTLIITQNEALYKEVIMKSNLQANGDIATSSLEDSIIIAINSDKGEAITAIIENQVEIEKVIHLDIAEKYNDSEYKPWDVVMPNSIISGEQAAFLEYAPEGDYDLEKFNLILNGTIWSKADDEDFDVDILDNNIFPITQILEKNNLLSKTIVLRGIWADAINNMLGIYEMVL